jgi:F-BAR domain only protein
MTAFSDYFWGEKNNGFDVLYHNMKNGQDSSREFAEFLRENCTVEESYVKLQVKLAKFASNCGTKGSFGPYWQVLKALAEKLSLLHQQLLTSWQELLKDVQKYNTDQQKKHREVKDHESSTMESVQGIQQTLAALHKAKEKYHACSLEYEKLKRENAAAKDVERAEAKLKKAHDDYRSLIEKYATVRVDFESSMTAACKRFQEVEEKHLTQLKEFVESYCRSWKNQYAVLGQVHEDFAASSSGLTVDKLIETFVQSKTTGTEKPGSIEFIEADLSALPSGSVVDMDRRETTVVERPRKEIADNVSQGSADAGPPKPAAAPGSSDKAFPIRGSHWILSIPKRRRNKKKKELQDSKKG